MRIVDLKGIGIEVLEISPGVMATINGENNTAVVASQNKVDISDLRIEEGGLLKILVPYWSNQIQLQLEIGHENVTEKTIYPTEGNQSNPQFVSHHGDQSQMNLMSLSYFVTSD